MFSRITLLIFCIAITWNFGVSLPTSSSEENLIDSSFPTSTSMPSNVVHPAAPVEDPEANLTKSVNLIHDLLLKTSQLIILNNLDKKVDAIVSHLNDNNVNQILQEFKQELLTEVKNIVNEGDGKKVCDEPVTVESLLGRGRDCTIKNRRFPEFFYAAEGFDYDTDRRRVFTWIPGWHDYQCLWNLERFGGFNDPNAKYKIKNVKYDEYLYAAADDLKHDNERRRLFTWKPKTTCESQCYWDIQLVKKDEFTSENYFIIRNTEYGEYFYAVDGLNYDDDRRHVFTWKFDPNHDVQHDHQSHWKIECK